MIPAAFDYMAPRTLAELLNALASGGEGTRPLAGGQSLIPMLKLRLGAADRLVDLGRIPDLRRIDAAGDPIVIGALATHAAIEDSRELEAACPLLPAVAREIGDRQVRNRGTIGGSLVHADPAADWPAAALALDAELVAAGGRTGAGAGVAGAAGAIGSAARRAIPTAGFFTGLMSTALRPGELLLEMRIRCPGKGGAAYEKVRQSASGFAIAGIAVVLEYGPDRVCTRARIGVTGVADRAYRATAAEQGLVGKRLEEATIAAAAARATDGVKDPMSDLHAGGEYRLHLARVHCRRALARAAGLGGTPSAGRA